MHIGTPRSTQSAFAFICLGYEATYSHIHSPSNCTAALEGDAVNRLSEHIQTTNKDVQGMNTICNDATKTSLNLEQGRSMTSLIDVIWTWFRIRHWMIRTSISDCVRPVLETRVSHNNDAIFNVHYQHLHHTNDKNFSLTGRDGIITLTTRVELIGKQLADTGSQCMRPWCLSMHFIGNPMANISACW